MQLSECDLVHTCERNHAGGGHVRKRALVLTSSRIRSLRESWPKAFRAGEAFVETCGVHSSRRMLMRVFWFLSWSMGGRSANSKSKRVLHGRVVDLGGISVQKPREYCA